MIKTSIILLTLFISLQLSAQADTEIDTLKSDSSLQYLVVNPPPEFPGGYNEFQKYLYSNLVYPDEARENKITGIVIVSFIIDTDGSITNAEIIRGLGYGCDDEVIRVLEASPKWEPGYVNGRPMKVEFKMPVSFRYQREKRRFFRR